MTFAANAPIRRLAAVKKNGVNDQQTAVPSAAASPVRPCRKSGSGKRRMRVAASGVVSKVTIRRDERTRRDPAVPRAVDAARRGTARGAAAVLGRRAVDRRRRDALLGARGRQAPAARARAARREGGGRL